MFGRGPKKVRMENKTSEQEKEDTRIRLSRIEAEMRVLIPAVALKKRRNPS